MKRLFLVSAATILFLTMGSICLGATNLNSSKSNIYRLVYAPTIMTQAQTTAILAELDKLGPADEARLKQWLPANFKRHGIQTDQIKKIVIRPADKTRKQITIILLTNPADVAKAIAVSDEGAPGPKKPTK
jgi:hypothetical protein